MKPPTRLLALALLPALPVLLAAPPAVHAAGFQSQRAIAAGEVDLPAMLAGLERQRATAIQQRDIATLLHLMDRDYLHVDSRGRVRSKTELLTALERKDFHFRLYRIESVETQVLEGGGAALVTGVFRAQEASAHARPLRFRFAHLWIRQPDGWKNSFHQSTAIRRAQDG
ncbi:nuclear transport factor 2 family protein [Massilia sp.]|uniref:nuclear transport factor 2 family protein n=1 Tax=Massilia sp. TaxID=1882437 RepID=UPI00391B2158